MTKDKQIWSRISTDTLEKLDAAARQTGMSRSAFIRHCVNVVLKNFKAKK